jgi:transcription elongation factor GreA
VFGSNRLTSFNVGMRTEIISGRKDSLAMGVKSKGKEKEVVFDLETIRDSSGETGPLEVSMYGITKVKERVADLQKQREKLLLDKQATYQEGGVQDKAALAEIDGNISDIDDELRSYKRIKGCKIIDNGCLTTSKVVRGSIVTVQFEGEDEEEDFLLLGPVEAVLLECYDGIHIVSYNSPMGKAYEGQIVGKTVSYEVKGGNSLSVTIKKIRLWDKLETKKSPAPQVATATV